MNVNRDVSLVIKAKNEASAGVNAAANSLKTLESAQSGAADSAKILSRELAALERSERGIGKSLDTTSAAVTSQAEELLATNRAITERKARIEELTRALKLLEAESGKNFVGPSRFGDPKAVADQIKAVKAQLRTAESGLNGASGLTASFDKQLKQLGDLRAAERIYRDGQAEVGAAIANVTAEINRQNSALQNSSAIQQRINALTGADRPATFDGKAAGASADVLRGRQIADESAIAAKNAAAIRDAAIAHHLFEERVKAGVVALKAEEAATKATAAANQKLADSSALTNAAAGHAAFEDAAKRGAQAMREAEAAAAAEAKEIAFLRDQLNAMVAIEARLAAEQARLNDLFYAGKIQSHELKGGLELVRQSADKAAKQLGTTGLNGNGALFGLRPHELQNLSFQINDVFTQLASGTSLTQTLGQQGGQLLQIFPKVGSAIVAAFTNPAFLVAAAVMGSIIAALNEAADQAGRVRDFTGTLDASADGASYQAKALAESARQLELYGVKATDATKAIKIFVKEGIDPDRINQFGKAAKDMADVLGITVPEAAQKLATAFSGGFDAVDKLDQELNFLTAAQRAHIKLLFDQGRAVDAVSEATGILSTKYGTAADDMRGPWSEAVLKLSESWGTFLDRLANSRVLQTTLKGLENLANGVSNALDRLNADRIRELDAHIKERLDNQGHRLKLSKTGVNVGGFTVNQYEPKDNSDPLIARNAAKELNGYLVERAKLQLAAQQAQEKATKAAQTELSERTKKANDNVGRETREFEVQNKLLSDQARIESAIAAAREDANKKLEGNEFKAADAATKRGFVEAAIGKARADTEKKIADERAASLAKEEQAIKAFSKNVIGPESGGRADVRNPQSSALGVGQFLKRTFVALFKETYPEVAKSLNDQAIADLRTNAEISKNLIEVYARKNADVLKAAGIAITEANLYAAHFLGSAGAKKLLKAAPNTPTNTLFGKDVIAANTGYFNKKDGSNRTAGELRTLLGKKIGDSSSAELQGLLAVNKLLDQRDKKQDEFDRKLGDQAEKYNLATESLRAQNGLQGEALLAEQRRQAVADAVLQKQQEIDRVNADLARAGLQSIEFTKAQRQAVEDLAGAYFDAAHAKDRLNNQRSDAEREVDQYTQLRDALLEQLDIARSMGDDDLASALVGQLENVNNLLNSSVDKLILFFTTLKEADLSNLGLTAAGLAAIVQGLENAKKRNQELNTGLGITKQNIASAFASSVVNAVDRFAQAVANGKNVIKALGQAFVSFAAGFLQQIAQMIIKAVAFKIAMKVLNAFGFPAGGFHSGGIAGGTPTFTRSVSPAWFAGAARYHSGGVAGLRPDEVPAILQRGEEVLTANDPRHRGNGGLGGGGGAAPNIKIVNAFDAADMLQHALGSKVGEKALMNYVRANSRGIKAALG